MFNLGFSEIVIIGVLALLLIGPKQLPEMAKVLGRLIGEFKKATTDLSGGLLEIKSELQKPMREGMDELQRMKNEILYKVEEEARKAQESVQAEAPQNTAQTQTGTVSQDSMHPSSEPDSHESRKP